MGASGNLFLEMRSAEIMVGTYDATFTKKEATKTGRELVVNAIEGGNVGKHELAASVARFKAVFDEADKVCREYLPHEAATVMGVEFKPVNGGETLNLTEDPVYCQLKQDLDGRVDLLKLAQKQDLVLDTYGNEVPRVGTTPRKSSITFNF